MSLTVTTAEPWRFKRDRFAGVSQAVHPLPLPSPTPEAATTVSPTTLKLSTTGGNMPGPAPVQTVAALASSSIDTSPNSVELEVWEGVVLGVDPAKRFMKVKLEAKSGVIEPHTADISIDRVPEQDLDLVRPGAIFYLFLFDQTTKGTVRNSQELRFRRRPDWSKQQIKKIQADAKALAGKMRARPASA
jgi:hypothetical protein